MKNRRLHFEKIQNARDLGGLKNKEGQMIRTGLLLRTANLSETSENDLLKLVEEYHLAKVIDLRTEMERTQKPDVVPGTAEYVTNPIFDERVFGISHEKAEQKKLDEIEIPALEDLYRMMLSEEMCLENFSKAVRIVMEHDFATGSVLWHCTEGKDRCGLLAVFLLSALGVNREVILEDYLLTNETNVPKAEMIGKQLEALGKPEAQIEAIKNTFLAKESYLNAAYGVIEAKYGDMDAFLREGLGISEETIVRFREKILA